ncbi:MAG: adenylate kinase family protein [Haloarculaceae archaeon]
MRVALTGTPGTGKTTVADRLAGDLDVVHLNDVIREEGLASGRDPDRDSLIADLDALRERVADCEDVLFESHLAHHLPVDRVIVLRCHPDELADRLGGRGWSAEKVRENVESERLDLLLSEAVAEHGLDSVYELDTTGRSPDAVADDVAAVLAGERDPSAGEVDFFDA